MICILSMQKASKNTFQGTSLKVEENLRTFQVLAQKFKDFQGKMQFKAVSRTSLEFKDFSRLCEPCNPAAVDPPLYIFRPKFNVHFKTNMQSTQLPLTGP